MKTLNLFIAFVITIFMGCSKGRSVEGSDSDGGSAESVEASDNDGGSEESVETSDNDGGSAESFSVDMAIVGVWQGVELGTGSDSIWTFTISEKEVTASTSGIEVYTGHYYINTDFVPHQVNFHIDSSSISSMVGKTSLAIYEIEDNVMRLAAAAPSESVRPKLFEPSSDGIIKAWELEKQ